ncbi:CsbD family protein [Streptomyces chromofuscus]|uniref:CsbD family protein n=1 Tax=Streptomyces chromofuscus TaxID=42881 RepID=A0A7M2T1H5_STRCW|nr:CsbD family protein [Streptomyces chromofuscus]QOV42436.1 CsbD family protein [Streptomyces chromofuscus]
MTGNQKAKAKAEQLKGMAKEVLGRTSGNRRMRTEGRSKSAQGDARQAWEKAKDAFRH